MKFRLWLLKLTVLSDNRKKDKRKIESFVNNDSAFKIVDKKIILLKNSIESVASTIREFFIKLAENLPDD